MGKRYQHVIWDWNGTLLNDIDHSIVSINKVLRKYDKPEIDLNIYLREFDFPVRDYYERIGFDFKEIPFEVVGTEFIKEYYANWQVCQLSKDALYVLESIKAAGLSQSILSAAGVDRLEECTSFFNIQGYFTELTGLNHHYANSKLDVAKEFMERSKLDPARVLFVGDTTHDYEVASAIGTDCILYLNGHHPEEKLRGCGVPIIHSLRQVLEYVQDWSCYMI